MNIIDHGKWYIYIPDTLPEHAPSGALYLKRESDGRDWYQLLNSGQALAPGSVKFTAVWQDRYDSYVVSVATYDGTRLFPVNQIAQEITDYTGSDPQADFGGKLYDPVTHEFSDPPPPVDPGQSLLDRIEALEAKLGDK